MGNKEIEAKCKNCRLYNPKLARCEVIILWEGEKVNLPVQAEDDCFFADEFVAVLPDGSQDKFKPEVQQVKFWVEDKKTGKKTNKDGVVKMEYPEGFFGPNNEGFKV